MAVTVTENMTVVSVCDSTTNFSTTGVAGSLSANGDIFKEGSASIGVKINAGTGGINFNFSAANWSGDLVSCWVLTTSVVDSAGTGIRVKIGDGTNKDEYEVLDSSTYTGGWRRVLVGKLGTVTPTVDNSVNYTAVTDFEVEFDLSTSIMGNINVAFVDFIQRQDVGANGDYCATISGGTTGARGTFQEIVDDTTNIDFGFVELKNGQYILNMPIEWGDSGTATTYFEDTGAYCVVQDQFVDDGVIKFRTIGNATGTNHFKLGTESGTGDDTVGSNGGAFIAAGTKDFDWICSDSNMDVMDWFGVLIDGAGDITWTDTVNQAVSCTLLNCDSLILAADVAEWRDGVISDSTAASGIGAVIITGNPAATANFRDMLIQNCTHAMENEVSGPITWDMRNITTINNTADIRFNHTTGLLTVNVLEGSTTFTTSDGAAGGTISVVSSNPITITVVEAEDFVTAIVGARVGVHKQSDNSEILNTTTNGSGVASGTTSFTGAVFVRVRDEDEGFVKIPATIVATTGLVTTVAVTDDNVYA